MQNNVHFLSLSILSIVQSVFAATRQIPNKDNAWLQLLLDSIHNPVFLVFLGHVNTLN